MKVGTIASTHFSTNVLPAYLPGSWCCLCCTTGAMRQQLRCSAYCAFGPGLESQMSVRQVYGFCLTFSLTICCDNSWTVTTRSPPIGGSWFPRCTTWGQPFGSEATGGAAVLWLGENIQTKAGRWSHRHEGRRGQEPLVFKP